MTDELPVWKYSVESQLETPVDTQITGEVPKWLRGTLYRNGSGMYRSGEINLKHLFDGFAVLHKFVIADGKVSYQSKLLDSRSLTESLKANRLVASQFSAVAYPDPCKSIFSRFFSYFTMDSTEPMDNTAVNIVPHGDMLIAMTETNAVNIVDPATLTRKETVRLDDLVAVHLATAHPHSDEDGTMYNLGTSFNPRKAYNIIKVPPQKNGEDNPLKRASLVSTCASRWSFNVGYNHSFGMTKNYFIVLEQTLKMNLLKLPFIKLLGGFESVMSNNSADGVLFHLLNRSDGSEYTTRYTTSEFFCFHFINCYEEQDHVIVDMIAFDSGDIVRGLYLSELLQEGQPLKDLGKFRRYVLPLNVQDSQSGKNLVTLSDTAATAVKKEDGTIFCTPDYVIEGKEYQDIEMELPRINYAYNTKKYRYVYGSGLLTERAWLTKLDLQTKTAVHWKTESKDQAGEPVFVSTPGGTAEDDGVILSPVIPIEPNRQAYLVILDAKSFKEIARAVTPPGVNMPISFHGSFI